MCSLYSTHGICCLSCIRHTCVLFCQSSHLTSSSSVSFYLVLHPASSPSDSIQAGSCLLLTVIDPRYEPDNSPISRLYICYTFLIFTKTIIVEMKIFCFLFFFLYAILNLIRLWLRKTKKDLQSARISSSSCTLCFPSFSSKLRRSKHISLIGCFPDPPKKIKILYPLVNNRSWDKNAYVCVFAQMSNPVCVSYIVPRFSSSSRKTA